MEDILSVLGLVIRYQELESVFNQYFHFWRKLLCNNFVYENHQLALYFFWFWSSHWL